MGGKDIFWMVRSMALICWYFGISARNLVTPGWPLSILIEIRSFHLRLYRFWLRRRIGPGNSSFHQRILNTPVKALRRFILMTGSEYPGIRRPYSGAAQSVDRMHPALRARSERFGWSLRNAFIRLTLALR